ncbi:hypothetical protein SPRG_03003 [Saprolegnia parasitica CBS 223.65]|uniref:SUEL-type lectin domain-containing protein n=1 Tax=Saprolegnia parasitica (strain CBS 223.65) TaxID=695850 RepID=A0A067D162_SAPPC|nr:hypothetical protein SPRG_03003 [Saprolegnia parasitica CBS 223.65]KDO32526.1 hypothetical protein SPRG_03003 [Saprolegnia parasitica CBS 223.65]|eukprot:XP_012196975.1 hypothetical protein SPRG_03003 [Saprolegnia parasitica CBS 223.65]
MELLVYRLVLARVLRVEAGSVQYIDKCPGATTQSVHIQTCKGKKLPLYACTARQNLNELFEFKDVYIKCMSNGQCLDGFRDGAKLGLHTYGRIKHSMHTNKCLDVDPTDSTLEAEM